MKKIVVASDSYKGSLNSQEVAEACKQAILETFPGCDVVTLPIGDGGEGTAASLSRSLGAKMVTCIVNGPMMQPVEATYGITSDGGAAIMDIASASGLGLVPPDRRNPMLTTTYGSGQLIMDAVSRGCRNIVIGLGGSATNDGGTGLLQALGVRFFDYKNQILDLHGGQILEHIAKIDDSRIPLSLRNITFTVASDVDSPFYGPDGASMVFSYQKGATETMAKQLEAGMRHFATIIKESGHTPVDGLAGAGAAGGTAGALAAFFHCEIKAGIEVVLDAIGFDKVIQRADLVITGEGRIDRQTVMGKAPYGVLRRAVTHNIPVIAVAGDVEDSNLLLSSGFHAVISARPPEQTLADAMIPGNAFSNIKTALREYFANI